MIKKSRIRTDMQIMHQNTEIKVNLKSITIESIRLIGLFKYSSPPCPRFSFCSFSCPLSTVVQKNGKFHAIPSSTMKSPAILFCPAQDLNHPFIQHFQAAYVIFLLVTEWPPQLSDLLVMVLPCLYSSNIYFA